MLNNSLNRGNQINSRNSFVLTFQNHYFQISTISREITTNSELISTKLEGSKRCSETLVDIMTN